jgi:hypothetical protein
MLALPPAQPQHRQSITHWVQRYKPLVRSESSCFLVADLRQQDDFVALGTGAGADRGGIEALLELLLKAWPRLAKLVCMACSGESLFRGSLSCMFLTATATTPLRWLDVLERGGSFWQLCRSAKLNRA